MCYSFNLLPTLRLPHGVAQALLWVVVSVATDSFLSQQIANALLRAL